LFQFIPSFLIRLRYRSIASTIVVLGLTTLPSFGQNAPNLAITKSHPGDFTTGQPGTYNITVSNTGSAATSGTVTLTDFLPQGMTAISLSNSGWNCTALPTTNLTCTRSDSLAPGGSYPVLTITVSVGNCTSMEINTAEVTGGGDSNFHTASDPTNIHTPTLAMTVTHNGDFVVGQTGTYTLTVTNAGDLATLGTVTVRDFLPGPDLVATAADGLGWDCSGQFSGFIICNNANTLQPGASYSPIKITVNVNSGAPSITNQASVTGGGDGVLHFVSDPTKIIAPVLSVTKSHVGNFTVGQTGTYTITVSNTGPVATVGKVTAIDSPPRDDNMDDLMVATAASGAGWSCTLPPPRFAFCTRSDSLAPGASYPPITVTVNVLGGGPQLTNFAGATGGGDSQNRSFGDVTNINAPVLTLVKSHTGDFIVGQPGVYTLTVSNTGNAATSGLVRVNDNLPFGLNVTSATGPGWSCAGSTDFVSCTRSDPLAPGSSYPPITLTVNVSGNGMPTVVNRALVVGGGDFTVHNVTDPTNVNAPTLAIAKTHTGDFTVGTTGTYTITVSNTSKTPSAGTVTVVDPLPGGWTVASATGTGWSCSGTTTVTCTRSDSVAGFSSFPPISLAVNVTGGGQAVTNTVFLSGGGDAINHSADDPTAINAPNLTILKSHTGDFNVGQPGTYTITVGNNGKTATAGTVTVTDAMPFSMNPNTATGTGWSCAITTDPITHLPVVTCSRSDPLAVGNTYPPISLTVIVDGTALTPTITNTATVSNGGDNVLHSSSDPTTIHAPTLSITKTHSGNFIVGQTTGTYTITVSNTGSIPSFGKIFVSDSMPKDVAATNLNATGWTCVPGEIMFNCSRTDSLAAGASYPPIIVSTRIDPNAAAVSTNTVDMSGGGDKFHTTTDPTNISLPDLAITKTHQGDFNPGQTGTYTITVSNVGTVATAGGLLILNDVLPRGLTPTAISGDNWNCSISTDPPVHATCNRQAGTLAPGSSYPPVTLTVNVARDAPISVTNIVDISGIGDANLNNNSASDVTKVNSAGLRFVPVTPCRVADTRNPNGAFGGPPLIGGNTRPFTIPDSACGIPATAQAYSLNATVVPKGNLGYLTMFSCGQTLPQTSTLNSIDGRIKAGAAIVPAGTSGAVCAFVTNDTDFVLDIDGYFVQVSNTTALDFYPLTPCRLVDTRGATGPLGGPSLVGNTARSFPILSSPCSVPSTAQAYSLNYTAVPKGNLGFLTTWPTGQTQPLVSTLNAPTGAVTANAAIVPAGTNGDVSVFVTNDSNLVIDINGYFAPTAAGGLLLFPTNPCRVLDTRNPAGSQPFNGAMNVDVAGSGCGAPATAQAFVLNATVVPPGPLGFLTLWPQGAVQPLVSTLNAGDGAVTSNMAIVSTTNGSISAFVADPSHLVLDISGYFGP
jgi:uncharacterized repeat protein (TIGR01451 family)